MQVSLQVSFSTNNFSDKLGENSDLIIFPECFRGPLETLWRATCSPGPLIAHTWYRWLLLFPWLFCRASSSFAFDFLHHHVHIRHRRDYDNQWFSKWSISTPGVNWTIQGVDK